MSEWQPIETAPKDGTMILVYACNGRGYSGDWYNGMQVAHWSDRDHPSGYGHKWRLATYQNLGDEVSGIPSHWMPLPEVPAGAEESWEAERVKLMASMGYPVGAIVKREVGT